MHNYDQHIDLIKRLRTMPKIGQANQPPPDPRRYDESAQKKADAIVLPDIAKQLAQLDNYYLLLNKLDTSVSSLQSGISRVVLIQQRYNDSIIKAVKNSTLFDEIEGKIANTLKITTKQSIALSNSYDVYIKKLQTSRSELDSYRSSLNKIAPGQAKNIASNKAYAETLLTTQQILQDYQGLTEDQANMYTLYTEGSGRNIASQLTATKALAESWETTTGQIGSFNTILTEVSSLSADVRSEYSRIPGNLELAVLKSKALGMSMADLDSIGTNLLDIEQSVGKEIEFQLISGRRLVDSQGRSLTNRFREAKLMRDGVAMAETMNDLVEEHGDIIEKGTYLDKKALADALGMDVESLVLAKQKVELNKKIADFAQKANPKQQFNKLTGEQQAAVQIEYEKALQKSGDTEQLNAIKELKKKEIDLKTPADRSAYYLKSIVDDGIFIQRKAVSGKQLETAFSPEKLQEFMQTSNVMAITLDKQNAAFLRNAGSMQTSMSVVKALTDTTDELVALYPGLKKLKDLLTNYIPQWIKDLVVPTPKSGYGETVNTTTKQDALMINDGVIRFHPSDKFMRVNDSTMIAGTSVDGNKKLAKSISGGGDTSKLVQAIQAAFAGVHITVNVDPMKIDREIKFRTATINV
jgi:hypothetical protein